jgi:hypothetical protein
MSQAGAKRGNCKNLENDGFVDPALPLGSIYFEVDQLRNFLQVGIRMAVIARPSSDRASLKFENLEH